MAAVAPSTRHVTRSPRTQRANTTFDTNWIDPSAASNDCAAKPNETKLRTLPPAKRAMPACHSWKQLEGARGEGGRRARKKGKKRPPIALQPFSPHGAGGLARVFDRLAPVVAQFHQVLKKKEKGKEGVSAGGRCHSAARLPPPAHRAQVDEDGPDLRAREVGKGWASRAGGGDGAARAVRPARASRRSLPRAL